MSNNYEFTKCPKCKKSYRENFIAWHEKYKLGIGNGILYINCKCDSKFMIIFDDIINNWIQQITEYTNT